MQSGIQMVLSMRVWYSFFMLKINERAPKFTLLDHRKKTHTLSMYLGHFVLLYFYPKDDTPGCTKEACAFRNVYSKLTDEKVVVLGISSDSVSSHLKFHTKYSLNFTLLSDPEKRVLRAYDAWGVKKNFGMTYEGTKRISYLVNPKGFIVRVYPKVKPEEHAQEVLADIQKLKHA